MCSASNIRMNCCDIYWRCFVMGCLTMGTIRDFTYGNPLTQGIPDSLKRNWNKEELNDLSGDGALGESQYSAKSHIKITVPVIYSSFSSFISHEASSSIAHQTFSETLNKVVETASYQHYTSESQSPLSVDYSIDVSTETNMEDCKLSHSSLPYYGPSSLLNTFIFRPSVDQPSPTPTWSNIESFTPSSPLRERSWWEVDEIPATSHEVHLSSPLPSLTVNLKHSLCISSCNDSSLRISDSTKTLSKVSTEINFMSSIVPTSSSSFEAAFSDVAARVSSSSSLIDASLILSDIASYICSTYLVSSIGASTSETTTLITDTSSVRTTRLPVFITDQFITSDLVTTTSSSNNILSTYRGIPSSSVLSIVSSTSDLNVIRSASFNIVTTPTKEVTHISTSYLDRVLSASDFNPTWTPDFSSLSRSTYESASDSDSNGASFWTTERSFATSELTDTSIFITSSPPIYKPPEVATYESIMIPATEYFRTTSYIFPEDTYTKSYFSQTVAFDVTTETSTKSAKPPSTESSTLGDMRYWVKTVVKAEPNILPINFLSIVKSRLAGIYGLAFSRREQTSRQKRETNDFPRVKIQFTKYTADWRDHQVELVYMVEYLGEPILALMAVEILEEVDSKEFSEIMGYMIIIKAEVYVKKEEISRKEQPWMVYAAIGTVGGILFFVICLIALYFRYCHVKEQKLDTESVRLKMFGQKNKQQAFQEETHRSQQEVKGAMDVARPLPQLPFQPLKKPKESSQRIKKTAKMSREKGLLISAETQTDGYYNHAYESDTTEASLTSVTSTQTSSEKYSQEELLPTELSKAPKFPSKQKRPKSESTCKASINEREDINSAEFESAKTSLFSRGKEKMVGNALSDTDAGMAETEIEVGRMRRRITELLDDALSYAGPKRMYSSLRSKPILPTSGAFHRWTSLRSPNRHELLSDSFGEAKSAESLPDVDPMKARHQPLFINLPPHKQPPTKPRVVWSIYKAGDEVSEISDELQAKASQQEVLETNYAPSSKLFEHRVFPPPTALLQPRPASPSSLIHPSFRPFSAPSIINASDTLRPPYAMEGRSSIHPSTSSSIPLLDTLQESSLSHHQPQHRTQQHYQRDEIDTATVLKFRQPAQSVIEAIREELNKFNTSLPNDDRESFA